MLGMNIVFQLKENHYLKIGRGHISMEDLDHNTFVKLMEEIL